MNQQRILFYFANSPTGGVLPRVLGYLRTMPGTGHRFLIHEALRAPIFAEKLEIRHEIQFVRPSPFQRLLSEDYLVPKDHSQFTGCFSYGAPISRVTDRFVLHISNALPLAWNKVTLPMSLRLKQALLEQRLRRTANQADRISVESSATADLVTERWGEDVGKKCVVLHNAFERPADTHRPERAPSKPYILVVGTHSYRRLDRLPAVLERIKQIARNFELVVVGTLHQPLPEASMQMNSLSHSELMRWMKSAAFYLSLSEIENSSNSLIEAAMLNIPIACTTIAPHMEILKTFEYRITHQWDDIVLAYPSQSENRLANWPTWQNIADETYELFAGFETRTRS